jgi:hypothetical protein
MAGLPTSRALAALCAAVALQGCVVDFPRFAGADLGAESDARPQPDVAAVDAAAAPDVTPMGDAAPADGDGDGVAAPADCDDADPRAHPGALEICGDGVDQDCDGADRPCPPGDSDGDGTPDEEDCGPGDPAVHPGAPEACNGTDDDCDGSTDEGLVGQTCEAGMGACRARGRTICRDGAQACDAMPRAPVPEIPGNGVDDDCNGLIDETPCEGGVAWPGNGHCYRPSGVERTWFGAGFDCVDRGGHLVTISSADENAFVLATFRAGAGDDIWIGAGDGVVEGTFGWVDGEPFGYANWAATEPNNAGLGEDCVEMHADGTWNDHGCIWGHPYVCEWE